MKRLALAAIGLVCLGGAALADPILGTWKTQPGDDGNYAHVAISGCGGKICGTLGKAFNSAGKSIPSDKVGKQMIWDMQAKGGGKYSGGKIWAPDSGKTYKSKMKLAGNALEVSGCVGPICRGQSWTRVK